MKTFQIKNINSLKFLKPILENYEVHIEEPLEIEPFKKWSVEFAASYWYAKYMLTIENAVILDKECKEFVKEENLNFIWLTISDTENFKLECRDGDFKLELYSDDDKLKSIFAQIIEDRR